MHTFHGKDMFLMHIFHRKDMHSAFVSRDGIDPFQSIACVSGRDPLTESKEVGSAKQL